MSSGYSWAMMFIASLAAAVVVSPPLAAVEGEPHVVKYGCNDIVVIGRLNNVEDSYEHVDIEDDILGHGWISAQVRIKRVLKGQATRRRVQARYLDHTYRVEDRDFVMVLTPQGGDSYEAHSFRLMRDHRRPTLISTCP